MLFPRFHLSDAFGVPGRRSRGGTTFPLGSAAPLPTPAAGSTVRESRNTDVFLGGVDPVMGRGC